MKRIVAILGIIGLGLAGFAGACNLQNFALTQVGANDTYGAEMQNNTGTNFLAHSFKVGFVDLNGNLVDSKTGISPCLRSWQNGTLDYFSVSSSVGAATTANAIGALDLGSPLIVGNTIATSSAFSNVNASTPTLSSVGQTSATVNLSITGTLKNNDSATYASANICAVVFNTSGQVVLTQKQSLGDIAASASSNFTMSVTVPNSTASVSSVTLFSDGLENNVPTTPISASPALNSGAAKVAFTTQPPTTTTGGAPFPVTVALQDSSGNTITSGAGSTASVTLSLSGGTSGATLTCDQASNTMAGVAGIAAFTSCKIDKVGTGYLITASSPGATSATSSAVAITTGPAAKLLITTQPSATAAAGSAFAVQPVVTIVDAGGNTILGTDADVADHIHVFASGGAVLTCTNVGGTTVPAAAGVANTFAGCSIDRAGTFTLTAQDQDHGLGQATSNSITVTPGLTFTAQPASGTHAVAFTTQPVVKIVDAAGAVITGDNTTTVTLSWSGPGALTCDQASNTMMVVSGVATFTGCKVDTAGTGTLTATSTPARGTATGTASIVIS